MSFSIELVCSKCGEPMDCRTISGGCVEVDPCESFTCSEAPRGPITMDYDDIIEIIQSKVRVTYIKKDRSERELVGFLGTPHESVDGIVYFIEREYDTDEPQVKCLIQNNILKIYQLDTGLEMEATDV